jgi:hypothetical protein
MNLAANEENDKRYTQRLKSKVEKGELRVLFAYTLEYGQGRERTQNLSNFVECGMKPPVQSGRPNG